MRLLLTVFLLLCLLLILRAMGALLGMSLRRKHPEPIGGRALGQLRGRLPATPGGKRQGLYAQVFYPADLGSGEFQVEGFAWVRAEVIAALADAQGTSPRFSRWLLGAPLQVDPPRAPEGGPGAGWPIIVFSSGLWGTCEMYTQLCRDLASGGAIVVAIEHEDGSGLHAIDGTSGQRIAYVRPPKGSDPRVFRRPFLEARVEELRAAAAAVASVAGQAGASPAAESPGAGALAAVLRCGDPGKMLLAGHSFGSSGAMRFLRRLQERGEPCQYKGVLLLDFWSECLEEADFARPEVPVAMFLSEEWERSPVLSGGCRALAGACGDRLQAAAVCRGTKHQWVSESHLFLPAWVLRRLGIMGSAEHARSYRATVRGAVLAAEGLLAAGAGGGAGPGAGAARLRTRLAEVDREAMQLFE